MDYRFGIDQGFSEFDYLSLGGRGKYYREIIRFMYFELQKENIFFLIKSLLSLRKQGIFLLITQKRTVTKTWNFLVKREI